MEQKEGSETVGVCVPACALQVLSQFSSYSSSGKKNRASQTFIVTKQALEKSARDRAVCNTPEQQ